MRKDHVKQLEITPPFYETPTKHPARIWSDTFYRIKRNELQKVVDMFNLTPLENIMVFSRHQVCVYLPAEVCNYAYPTGGPGDKRDPGACVR